MLFSYEGKFYQTISKLTDAVLLSILWLLFSFPLITIGASTTALYYTVEKNMYKEEGHLWQEFWKAFKRDFKQSTVLWSILIVLFMMVAWGCVAAYSFLLLDDEVNIAIVIFSVYSVIIIIWSQYWFPYLATFEDSIGTILKNTISMAISDLKLSILLLVVFVITVIAAYLVPPLLLILPVVYMWTVRKILQKIFSKYIDNPEDNL